MSNRYVQLHIIGVTYAVHLMILRGSIYFLSGFKLNSDVIPCCHNRDTVLFLLNPENVMKYVVI